ncbi:MAG: hypothetical protein ACRDZ9_04885 [Acidimicrobiales bacterium]
MTPAGAPAGLARAMVALALVTAFWAGIGTGVRATYGARTTADEPQYLLSATSLAEDGDLDIADELAAERWRAWHEVDLPTQTEPQADGSRVSPHGPLLAVVLALPVAWGGWVGAKVALAGVTGALAATMAWVAVRRLGVPVGVAGAVVACFSLAPPLAVYGTQVYPELPAALVVTAVVGALSGPLGPAATAATALGVTALPWLGVKYVPVAAALAGVALWRLAAGGDRRRAAALAAALVLSAAAFTAGHLALYGGLTPYVAGDHFVGGQLTAVGAAPDYLGRSRRLLGLLVDRRFGLVAWQPAWLLGLPALAALARRRPRWWPALVLALAAGWLTATFVALTMHGYWWPGRQVVVVAPLVVLAVAWWVAQAGRGARALVAGGLVAGAATFAWLVADGLAGRLTWVVGFDATTNPGYRLWRLALPDLASPGPGDEAGFAAWVAVAGLLVAAGWGGAGGRAGSGPSGRGGDGDRDQDAGGGEVAQPHDAVLDAHRHGAVG